MIFGSLIGSKTLMELIFNPCGEFRCEVRRAQLAKSTLPTSKLEFLFRSFTVCSFGQNCYLSYCVCSERPAIRQNILMMTIYFRTRQHQRSMTLVMHIFDDCDGQCYPGTDGVYVFPTSALQLRKSSSQKNCPKRCSNRDR